MFNQQKKKRTQKENNKTPSLLKEITNDLLLVHWFIVCLILLLISSAMLQAKTSHDVRKIVAQWQGLREENQQQQIKWQSLRLEMTSLTEADRIARLAKKQLDMIDVNSKNEKIINY